jgi:hypothetical protein
MDVVSAFLHANVESEIYMGRSQGYGGYGDKGQSLVFHLKKALYGIREAPKAWNELFTVWLIDYGFVQSLVDPGVFTYKHGNLLYIVALYVDASILIGKEDDFIRIYKAALAKRFEIEDLGPVCWLLGCRIERERGKRTLRLGQEQYVTDIREEFNMCSAVHVGTPMAAKIALEANSYQPLDN